MFNEECLRAQNGFDNRELCKPIRISESLFAPNAGTESWAQEESARCRKLTAELYQNLTKHWGKTTNIRDK